MRLILRSPDEGEGWRGVSAMLLNAVRDNAILHPDLYEFEVTENGPKAGKIRLTKEGVTVAKYV